MAAAQRESLNFRMLADGYATVLVMEELPFEELLYRVQKEAIDAGAGLWQKESWRSYALLNQLGQ